jgi:RND family efflux transporter MFP subunit
MKRSIIIIVILGAVAGAWYYANRATTADAAGDLRQRGGGGFGFGPGSFQRRLPMAVELADVKRGDMVEHLTVVGNLIGEQTVEAVPKVSGRLDAVMVRLGDRVSRGQTLAKVEDRELQEQIKQAQASFDVAAATIRQREADLKLAQTNLDRTRNLFERQLIPKQTYDDTEARHQAAVAQVDLARAQYAQAQARLDELKITMDYTSIVSPVSGFVGKRALDPGAWVTPNSSFISVVDISIVRLVANIIEKDLRRIEAGMKADVEVDAFPGDKFAGRIARVAPVLDPSTRTAQIEVEIDNRNFRLKPGMYAKVSFVIEHRANTLIVPANAIVDVTGNKGVYVPGEGDVATFQPVTLGMVAADRVEITSGLTEGTRIISTGAAALREGDRIVLPGRRETDDNSSGPAARGQGRPGVPAEGGGRGGPGSGGGRRGGAPSRS